MTHAWIFTGPPGSGRLSAATAFAAALVCPQGGCGTCQECRSALTGGHPDVEIVRTEGLSIKIDEIRELLTRTSWAPSMSGWRVVVMGDADRMTESVLNLHKLNSKVAGVSALNSVPKNFISEPDLPFRYSAYASVWGWAINKESWNELREPLLSRIPVIKAFPPSARNSAAKLRWQGHLSRMEENLPDSWDYRLQLALFSLEKYFVVTNCNYSLNVGFGEGATNTRNRPQWVPSEYGKSIPFPIDFKQRLRQDFKADNCVAKRMHHTKNAYWLKTRSRRFFFQIVKPN